MKHFRLVLFSACLSMAAVAAASPLVKPQPQPAKVNGDPIACWPFACDDPPPQQGGGNW